jgi:hypothetical protein
LLKTRDIERQAALVVTRAQQQLQKQAERDQVARYARLAVGEQRRAEAARADDLVRLARRDRAEGAHLHNRLKLKADADALANYLGESKKNLDTAARHKARMRHQDEVARRTIAKGSVGAAKIGNFLK